MIIASNIKIRHSSLFIEQLFIGTRYSLKISENTVYICVFKTYENYFSFERDDKGFFEKML